MAEVPTRNGGQETLKPKLDDMTDVTERTIAQLTELSSRELLTVAPRDLYAIVPDGTLQRTEYASGGCSYNDSVFSYPVNTGDMPVKVRTVSKLRDNNIVLEFTLPDSRSTSSVDYRLPDLEKLRFYEQPDPTDNEIDRYIQEELSGITFIDMPGEALAGGQIIQASVRARDPLGQPVGLMRRSGYDYPQPVVLDGTVEHLQAYYDKQAHQEMVQVTVGCGAIAGNVTSDWMPLSALEFYLTKLTVHESLARRLYARAQELIRQTNTKSDFGAIRFHATMLTDVLEEANRATGRPASYLLPYERHLHTRPSSHQSEFIIGRLATNGTQLESCSPVDLSGLGRELRCSGVHLRATQVAVFDRQPWVVDDTNLATPLVTPAFSTNPSSFSANVADYLSEQAGLRGQTG